MNLLQKKETHQKYLQMHKITDAITAGFELNLNCDFYEN
jgi:hypothetical protein